MSVLPCKAKTILEKHLFLILSNLYNNHNNQWHFPQYFLLFFGTVYKIVDDRGTPENTFCFTCSLFPNILIFFWNSEKNSWRQRYSRKYLLFHFWPPRPPCQVLWDNFSFFPNIYSQYDPKLSTLNKNTLKTSVWNDGQLFLLLRPLRRARENEGGLKEKQVVIARRHGTLPLSNSLIKRNIF